MKYNELIKIVFIFGYNYLLFAISVGGLVRPCDVNFGIIDVNVIVHRVPAPRYPQRRVPV